MGALNNIPDVVKNLLIINLLVFLAGIVIPGIENAFALRHPQSEDFEPFQFVTHFFTHAGFMHLFFNMFALVMFGSQLERMWGAKRFLLFYFLCALGASVLYLLYNSYDISGISAAINAFEDSPSLAAYNEFFKDFTDLKNLSPEYRDLVYNIGKALKVNDADPLVIKEAVRSMDMYLEYKVNTPMVGASGAVYGLLVGFGMLFPNTELMLIFLPIPIKAKYFIPVLIIIELYLGMNSFSWDNIAHFAHLGGALIGFIIVKIWQRNRNTFY